MRADPEQVAGVGGVRRRAFAELDFDRRGQVAFHPERDAVDDPVGHRHGVLDELDRAALKRAAGDPLGVTAGMRGGGFVGVTHGYRRPAGVAANR